ncbi:MAG TPA: phosphodiester glycosidase family protein, partial [Longimicrobiaceae bacterium]|nr:phosphodiester glycosidase family protein [Longimicrobiaceae bacterium]
AAPSRWRAPLPAVAEAVEWRPAAGGAEWGTLELSGSGEAWRTEVVLVRFAPERFDLQLASAYTPSGIRPDWAIDRAPDDAALAFNAGQFRAGTPWGWVVREGREQEPPGRGALSMALVVTPSGAVRLLREDSLGALPADSVRLAFQSYPTLLQGDGRVPASLARPGAGVDVAHRDSRLALGQLRDGRLLVAITRFDALGGALDLLPFGLTTPEMAALMGALGCRRAVLLDGGISGQLLLRDAGGGEHAWRGLRRVPLGLVVTPRPP